MTDNCDLMELEIVRIYPKNGNFIVEDTILGAMLVLRSISK
ncbi:MAG TPA: hypothetical protein VGL34_20470 [Steroidobacteraceae bacterium]